MTYSELDKWRKVVPFAIFAFCILPWFLVSSKSLADAKLANDLIVPAIALVAAFFYVGFNFRRPLWDRENDAHVRKQIRDGVLDLIPRDLAVSENERHDLQGEVFKELTGVFWEAIDGNDVLRSHKEHFYSNGIVYSTSIDAFLICGFAGLVYIVISFILAEAKFAYWGAGLIAIAVGSRILVTPRTRARHMELSREQLDLLRRERGDFVSNRFSEIIASWRRERILRSV
jgi:hypothetical protein